MSFVLRPATRLFPRIEQQARQKAKLGLGDCYPLNGNAQVLVGTLQSPLVNTLPNPTCSHVFFRTYTYVNY